MDHTSTHGLVKIENVSKSFGHVHALRNVNLEIPLGQCTGVVGHNGAGKSTLINVITGFLRRDSGHVSMADIGAIDDFSINRRNELGIRCVFQELSLCPNLTVAENVRILHRSIKGLGWRRQASKLVVDKLDEIFPGHGIHPDAPVGSLALGARQMVEIARAFTHTDISVRMVILDEPTSSLDSQSSAQLLAFIRKFVAAGNNCLFVSHKLDEVVTVTDRVVVMKDGTIVHEVDTGDTDRAGIVEQMGSIEALQGSAEKREFDEEAERSGLALLLPYANSIPTITLRRGEVIGLAGLAGDGQTEALKRILALSGDTCAFVAGDRAKDGIFPLWSIRKNISIRSLPSLIAYGLVKRIKEIALAETWKDKIGIRTPTVEAHILSLSGGNQQKVLFARVLASDATIILMDDSTRGVDIGTKREIYKIIENEADAGRSFLWYSTEIDELHNCDRVLVFGGGIVAAVLEGDEITEENVIKNSFAK